MILLPAGLGLVAAASSGGLTGLKSGLMHWWSLDEASGTRADSHGGKSFNTIVGTVTGAAGKINNGASASSGSYMQCAGIDLSSGDFTIAGVFKTAAANYGIFSRNGTGASIDRQYLILLEGGVFYFGVSTDGATNAAVVSVGSGLNNGALHDYIVWRDTGANTINAQLNGGSVVSAALSGATVLYHSTNPGTTMHGVGTGTYVNGGLNDETGVWSRTLTGAERSTLRNGGAWLNYASL